MTTNKLFRQALAERNKLPSREVDAWIAEKATILAESAGVSYGGHSERQGVVFNTGMNTGAGSAFITHACFDYESVIDNPSIVTEWANRKLTQMTERKELTTAKPEGD